MKKILVLLFIFLILCFTYACNYSYANIETNSYDLFFPDISERTTPNDLLVMVFLYDDYINHNEKTDYVFNMTDQEIETKYYNEIFGSGNIDEQTWSVNDFYKENSNGKFYFNPILIGNNTTGIYPIRFNKTYDMEKFSSDIKEGFKILEDKGFVPGNEFNAKYSGKTQEKQVICIFPTIKVAHYGTYVLNEEIVSNVVVMDYCSVVSTAAHELGHALEMPDLYRQGGQATLMGETTLRSTIPDLRYPGASNNHTLPAHVDPLHKIALGWHDYEIIDENSTVKLYPTTSPLYNIVIVPTKDNNQYYIIENRKADSFESQITMYASRGDIDDPEDAGCSDYEGVNIWRVDKLGYDTMYPTPNRKGDFIISTLKYPNTSFFPRKYSDISDSSSNLKEKTDIKITYVQENADGSIDVDISFDDRFANSYVVRYNANDGTDNYVDIRYEYAQIIDFPTNLFSREGNEFKGWNTKPDGNGIAYNIYDNVYGLSDENEAIVNLYAQWEKTSFTVTFNTLGGSFVDNQTVKRYNKAIEPEPPTKEGYTFMGWYEDSTYQFKFYFERSITEDTTLYAKWFLNEKFIKNININIEKPKVGEEATIETMEDGYWQWGTQKPLMEITIPNEANYHLYWFEGEFNYMEWIAGLDGDDRYTPFVGKFEYNSDYYAKIYLETDSEYCFADDVEVIVNGKDVDKIFGIYDNFIELGVKLTTDSEEFVYEILEGDNQTYIVEEKNDLTVKANGEVSKFNGIKVDDKIIETSNYIVVSGSTVVTIKKEYLGTLAEGKHTLTFLYIDGEVSTEFTIVKDEIKDEADDNTTNSSPKTGDNIELWVTLILVSTLGILGTYKYIKKKIA